MMVVLAGVFLAAVMFMVMRVMLGGCGRFAGGCAGLLRYRTQRQG
jgi:hypothetical protein